MTIGAVTFGPSTATSLPLGKVMLSQTALSVKCGLGHNMVKIAPVRYECKECGFTVIVLLGGKS